MLAYNRLKKCADFCNDKTHSVKRETFTTDTEWSASYNGVVKVSGHGTGQNFTPDLIGNSLVIPKSLAGLDSKFFGMSNVSYSSGSFNAVKGNKYKFSLSVEGVGTILDDASNSVVLTVGSLSNVPRTKPTINYDTNTKNIKFIYPDDRTVPAKDGQGAIPSDFVAVFNKDLCDGTFQYDIQLVGNQTTPCGGILQIEYATDPLMYIDIGEDYK